MLCISLSQRFTKEQATMRTFDAAGEDLFNKFSAQVTGERKTNDHDNKLR